jgi:hypothetical protein
MVYNDYPVPTRVNIELDCVGAELERLQEGRNRIFGQCTVSAPMRDPFGAAALASWGQSGLGVVALEGMSAKL